ncbi:MAG: (2Fe-2S) ferredoxin domain-containing protein [Clostridiales bacterium]|jgi:NADP-reducing hydrogenase subunit HndB|nr:(2Fe-2S) ferredoxin domain-containing protein [Clostridiales bacterium]
MKTIADIKAIRDKMQAQIINRDNFDAQAETRIVVGMATCGIAAGARPVFNEFVEQVQNRNLKGVKVVRTGCLGMCKVEPIVEILVPGEPKVTYVKVDQEKAKNIVAKHIVAGQVCTDYLVDEE